MNEKKMYKPVYGYKQKFELIKPENYHDAVLLVKQIKRLKLLQELKMNDFDKSDFKGYVDNGFIFGGLCQNLNDAEAYMNTFLAENVAKFSPELAQQILDKKS